MGLLWGPAPGPRLVLPPPPRSPPPVRPSSGHAKVGAVRPAWGVRWGAGSLHNLQWGVRLPPALPDPLPCAGASSPVPEPLPQLHFSSGPSLRCSSPAPPSRPATVSCVAIAGTDAVLPACCLSPVCPRHPLLYPCTRSDGAASSLAAAGPGSPRVPSGRLRGWADSCRQPHLAVVAQSHHGSPISPCPLRLRRAVT